MSGYTIAAAAVVATTYSIYSGEQQKSAQKEAMNKQQAYNSQYLSQTAANNASQLEAQNAALSQQKAAQASAEAAAKKQEKQAEENLNRTLSKSPDTAAILSSAEQSAKTGGAGTMLTGAQGVDPASLTLEKKTLLGA